MNIKQFAKAGKISSSVKNVKRCNAVDIGFLTIDGREDETQLDVEHSILTKKGLDELFAYMAEELEADESGIYYINIVAAADTMEGLEAMGF